MTQASSRHGEESSAEVVLRALGTRVDAPHRLGDGSAADAAVVDQAVADAALPDAVLEVQNQARQLSTQLNTRRDDLDRREALLNSQQAELENQLRAARLWLDERRAEAEQRQLAWADREQTTRAAAEQLAQETARQTADTEQRIRQLDAREAALAAREQQLSQLAARLAERESALAHAQQEIASQRDQLAQSARHARQQTDAYRAQTMQTIRLALAGVEQRRVEVERAASEAAERLAIAAFVPSQAELALAEELESRGAALREREKQLAAGELLLQGGQQELADLRRELLTQRDDCAAQARHDRQVLAQQHRQAEQELNRQRGVLTRQGEQLDARRAALEQMRAELSELHQEALELRLATEELWGQLSASVAPALLSKSLAALRARLKDRQRLESADLAQRKAELESLRMELQEQHARLSVHKEECLSWWTRRQQEIEDQAAKLVQREQELEQQETEYRAAGDRWREERFQQQQEIRRLHAQLRRAELAA